MQRLILPFLAVTVVVAGCSTAPTSKADKQALSMQVQEAVNAFQAADPGITRFFRTAYGYAVFPSVGKGGIGIGGAYGQGEAFQKGKMIGWCDLSQASIGFQLGGQEYRELIFFQAKENLDAFTSGNYSFSAQASAVALKSGVSANAKYAEGVAVFTLAKGGLMYEASIGGQKFSFKKK